MRGGWILVIVCAALSIAGSSGVDKGQAQAEQGLLIPPVSIEPWGLPAIEPLYSGCGGADAPPVNAGYEGRVVELTNAERTSRGLPPLKRVDGLDRAARYHSTDMGQDNYFKHDTYDGNGGTKYVCSTWDRILNYYEIPNGGSWMAENIAAGYGTPRDVVTGWMNSSGHRNNILSQNAWEIGVGYYSGSGQWGSYWTQDFGKRTGFYPLVINDEARETASRQISIYIYGNWQEMRLRNEAGAWGAWQPFQTRFDWTLANGTGDRSVTAELRKPGETASSSDSIYSAAYDPPVLGNVPGELVFYYSILEGEATPGFHQITPVDVSDGATLSWQLTRSGNWFNLAPLSGSSPPGFFTITPDNFDHLHPGVYQGSVAVTITDPQGVSGSPHTILLTLFVVDTIERVFIPLVDK